MPHSGWARRSAALVARYKAVGMHFAADTEYGAARRRAAQDRAEAAGVLGVEEARLRLRRRRAADILLRVGELEGWGLLWN